MKKRVFLLGGIASVVLGLCLVLNAEVVGHCWWWTFCSGDCICTGTDVDPGPGRCEFTCYQNGVFNGRCTEESFPFHCTWAPY